MDKAGAKIWYFPDGYLPEKSTSGSLEAHEALMLLNVNTKPANVRLDFYFEDRDPVKDIPVTIAPERICTLRLDRPEHIGGLTIPPLMQYSIRIRSDVEIVAQFGRLDATQPNLAYYGSMGFHSDSE